MRTGGGKKKRLYQWNVRSRRRVISIEIPVRTRPYNTHILYYGPPLVRIPA